MGWAGKLVSRTPTGRVVLEQARPFHAMTKGTSDCIGWTTIEITPALVGTRVAVFTAIEVKDKGKLTDAQRNFIERVKEAGGIAGCARSAEQAQQIIAAGPPQTDHGERLVA